MSYAKQHILLVDDDPGILVAVKHALAAHGYEVTTATNGIEALAAFEQKPPELILLDLILPRCDGLEVCRDILEQSHTPIIVLSIRGSEADIVSLLDLGVDDYLVKPFRLAELLARVRAVLRRTGKLPAARCPGDRHREAQSLRSRPYCPSYTNRVRAAGRTGGECWQSVDHPVTPAAGMGSSI
jgi:DNA-binding response OmpR family regulator